MVWDILQILVFVIIGSSILIYKNLIIDYALKKGIRPPIYFIVGAILPLILFFFVYLLLFIHLQQIAKLKLFMISLFKVLSISYSIVAVWIILWNIHKISESEENV